MLTKLGVLFGERGDLLAKFSVFVFGFCDPSQIKLFFGRFHRPLHVWLLVSLSDTCGHPPEPEKDVNGVYESKPTMYCMS